MSLLRKRWVLLSLVLLAASAAFVYAKNIQGLDFIGDGSLTADAATVTSMDVLMDGLRVDGTTTTVSLICSDVTADTAVITSAIPLMPYAPSP